MTYHFPQFSRPQFTSKREKMQALMYCEYAKYENSCTKNILLVLKIFFNLQNANVHMIVLEI